jgi:phosphoribosylformylglycinamidine cyclo-ligase
MSDSIRYQKRGVSATKDEVHKAVTKVDKGLYPNAFCKIYPDRLNNDNNFCNIIHADGAGTKSVLAYLYWKETGNIGVWKGISQDAIVMNTDDLLCVGVTSNLIMSSIINRNKHLIPGEVLSQLIQGTEEFLDMLTGFGVDITLMGGETADMGDVIRTVTVDAVMTARPKRENLITNENIQPGDVIVGLASYGKTTYENEYNSGIGSNGLTSGRHDVLCHHYALKYPECYDPKTPEKLVYCGHKKLTDKIKEVEDLDVGRLLLSPTRTYLPAMKQIFENIDMNSLHGVIHCSGGGQTKILHYINNLHVIKNNLFPAPPLFHLIQKESSSDWKEMYQVFNMGHRMEIYTTEQSAQDIISIAQSYNIDAQIIGHVEGNIRNKLTIQSAKGEFIYE